MKKKSAPVRDKLLKTDIPIYGGQLNILISEELPAAWHLHFGVGGNFDPTNRAQTYMEDWRVFIGLAHNCSLGTIAHEASHAAKGILRYVNVDDEEAECYLLGWIVNQIDDLL